MRARASICSAIVRVCAAEKAGPTEVPAVAAVRSADTPRLRSGVGRGHGESFRLGLVRAVSRAQAAAAGISAFLRLGKGKHQPPAPIQLQLKSQLGRAARRT